MRGGNELSRHAESTSIFPGHRLAILKACGEMVLRMDLHFTSDTVAIMGESEIEVVIGYKICG
jgi:hypothetical protein